MKREKFITTKAAHTNPNPQSKEQEHVHENPYVAVEALESSLTSPDGTGASVPAKRSIDVSFLSPTYTRSDVLGQYTKYKGKQAPELRDADSLKDMENLPGGKCKDFLFHALTAEICSENFQNSSMKEPRNWPQPQAVGMGPLISMNTQCPKIAPVFPGPAENGEVWSSAMGEQAQAAFLEEFDVESEIEDDSEATDFNSGGESEYEHDDDVVHFTDENKSLEDNDWEPWIFSLVVCVCGGGGGYSFIELLYS